MSYHRLYGKNLKQIYSQHDFLYQILDEYLPSRIWWSTTLQQKFGYIQASILGSHMQWSETFL